MALRVTTRCFARIDANSEVPCHRVFGSGGVNDVDPRRSLFSQSSLSCDPKHHQTPPPTFIQIPQASSSTMPMKLGINGFGRYVTPSRERIAFGLVSPFSSMEHAVPGGFAFSPDGDHS
jgi:hypothetical protein